MPLWRRADLTMPIRVYLAYLTMSNNYFPLNVYGKFPLFCLPEVFYLSEHEFIHLSSECFILCFYTRSLAIRNYMKGKLNSCPGRLLDLWFSLWFRGLVFCLFLSRPFRFSLRICYLSWKGNSPNVAFPQKHTYFIFLFLSVKGRSALSLSSQIAKIQFV